MSSKFLSEDVKHPLMSTVRHKKWWTVLRCLVSIIGFECFDLVNILNKTKVYSLFVLNSLLLVDTFSPQEGGGGVRFEFSLGQQNKLNNVLFCRTQENSSM